MDWKNVTFSNEKCLNLDEADDFNSYFHDLRKTKDIRWSRSFKGGSLLLWRAFPANRKTDLVVVASSMITEERIKKLTCATFSILCMFKR